MTIKLAYLICLLFAAFSTENTNDEDNLQALIQELELDKRARDLQKWENTLQKREKNVKAAEEGLHAREVSLQKREQNLKQLKASLYEREQKVSAQEKIVYYREHQKSKEKLKMSTEIDMHYSKPRNSSKIIITDKEWNNQKIIRLVNLFPNESPVKVFRDMETDELSWEDPNNLIEIKIKSTIESSLKKNKEAMSNGLFNCISTYWDVPYEAELFVKELCNTMVENVDVDKRDERYRTPMMVVAIIDAEKAVVKLIEKGAKLEVIDIFGRTALHLVAYWGRESSCKILLQNGADINAKDMWGNTPITIAAQYGNGRIGVVKILLQYGANIKYKNKRGKTALDLATQNCAEVLRKYEEKLEKLEVEKITSY